MIDFIVGILTGLALAAIVAILIPDRQSAPEKENPIDL